VLCSVWWQMSQDSSHDKTTVFDACPVSRRAFGCSSSTDASRSPVQTWRPRPPVGGRSIGSQSEAIHPPKAVAGGAERPVFEADVAVEACPIEIV